MGTIQGPLKLIGIIVCIIFGMGAANTIPAQSATSEEKAAVYRNVPAQQKQIQSETDATIDEVKDAKYWYDRGTLLSVYGNTSAAIDAFKKAVELEPANGDALFQLGIEYGTAGRYQEAIAAIDKALAINSRKPVYYYGRGWVYLLSGDKEKAVQDFRIAAQQGNRDAIEYLRRHVPE